MRDHDSETWRGWRARKNKAEPPTVRFSKNLRRFSAADVWCMSSTALAALAYCSIAILWSPSSPATCAVQLKGASAEQPLGGEFLQHLAADRWRAR